MAGSSGSEKHQQLGSNKLNVQSTLISLSSSYLVLSLQEEIFNSFSYYTLYSSVFFQILYPNEKIFSFIYD